MTKGMVVVLSAPSGGGKTTVVDRLLKRHPDWVRSVSVTTRPLREGEAEGRDYRFVTAKEFRRMEAAGEFLESAGVLGHHYGTPRKFVLDQCRRNRCVILTVDIQGMRSVKKALDHEVALVTVFILPPSLKVLRERLEGRRTETPEAVDRRLALAAEEIKAAGSYDHTVVNQSVEETVVEIENIINRQKGTANKFGDSHWKT